MDPDTRIERRRRRERVRRRRARLAAAAVAAFAVGAVIGAARSDDRTPARSTATPPRGTPEGDGTTDRRPADARAAGRPHGDPALRRHRGARLRAAGAAGGPRGGRDPVPRQRRLPRPAARPDAQPPARLAGPRAIVCVDQEGGEVRILPWAGPERAAADQVNVRADALAAGRQLRAAGVGVTLAPVADVPSVAGAALGARAFSSDPQRAATAVAEGIAGWHAAGVATTVKHFPGLGGATVNTDDGSATIKRTRTELDADLVPFRAAIDAGTEFVMAGHATYPALDGLHIASQSPADDRRPAAQGARVRRRRHDRLAGGGGRARRRRRRAQRGGVGARRRRRDPHDRPRLVHPRLSGTARGGEGGRAASARRVRVSAARVLAAQSSRDG